jgi:oligoribonuclease
LQNKLIWIDLEMTSLNPEKGVILEIATLVTDAHLEVLAEGPNIAINHPPEILEDMDEWSKVHHEASGLLHRVQVSSHDCGMTERITLEFLSGHCRSGDSPLCGNSVWQDRRFLIKYMPSLDAFFHYRIIDVSTIKELVKRWYPALPLYKKQKTHLALDDIRESINELKYYRNHAFVT